jgi:hypothetical protein
METVTERVPLAEVAEWWLDMWQWRTDVMKAEEEAGRFNPYDALASTRAPWSLVVSKYPWINVDDRRDIAPLVKAGMKKRSKGNPEMTAWYKALVKEEKDFERPRSTT